MLNNKNRDMNPKLPHRKFYSSFVLGVLVLSLVSCGSYQQASYYDDDGIYSSGNRVVSVEKRNPEAVRVQETESNIYGEYFGQIRQLDTKSLSVPMDFDGSRILYIY